MKRFKLSCVSRETGQESTEVIVADDERSAYEQVANKGKMVAKVLGMEDLTPKPETPLAVNVPRAVTVRPDNRSLEPDAISVMGVLLCLAGAGTMVFAVAMDTTGRSDVYNIGLLNHQTIAMIAGGTLFVSGTILCGLHTATNAICRRLPPIPRS
ncbi:MAG: hypothetical protein ACK54H_10045 [Phycisphaerales bacterium]